VVAIGYSGKDEAVELLRKALKDPSSDVRYEAVEKAVYGRYVALGREIADMMYDEPSKKVKIKMFKICGPMRMDYAAPVLARIAANDQEDKEVRMQALETIYKLSLTKPEERFPLAGDLLKVMKVSDKEVSEKARKVASVLVRGRPPKTLEGWERWHEEKKQELAILRDIERTGNEVDRLEKEKKYEAAEELLFKIQDLYNRAIEICDDDDRPTYEGRARRLNIRIRHMQQRARLIEHR
jgi:hypothetical protein